MPKFHTGSYDALIDVLETLRKAKKLTLRKVADRLPEWLGFDWSTLHKIEARRRDVSFVEVQELAKVYGSSVAEIDQQAGMIAAARMSGVQPRRRTRTGKSLKKR